MRRATAATLTVLALGGVASSAPASAADAVAARHILTLKAARRAIGKDLREHFKYGAKPGSLLAFCGRRSRFHVRCDILFQDSDGDSWCGGAGVRAVGANHRRLRVRYDHLTTQCESF